MKEWFRYFRIWFLVCGILLIGICATYAVLREDADAGDTVRVNEVCTETERVLTSRMF